jgi:hypothetical protein
MLLAIEIVFQQWVEHLLACQLFKFDVTSRRGLGFLSPPDRTSCHDHSLDASSDPKGGDLDVCAS